jgi:para-aminobenzoate synthetase / 4-amino-4-deoxychorismate lyase
VTGAVARFDDLRGAGKGFVLSGQVAELRADTAAEVAGVVRAAEAAARAGRWVAGFLAYEAAAGLDAGLPVVPRSAADPLAGLPLAWFGVFGRQEETTGHPLSRAATGPGEWVLDRDGERHRAEVEQIRSGIARGEFYQVNLTARLHGREVDPAGRYAAMALRQRAEFTAFLSTGEHHVLSASPELFLHRQGRSVTTRPMKGTARRGRTPAEDAARRRALTGSAKDRAENVMIVDLLRNDLSKVAETGSVQVTGLLTAERYPTVWQLTSTVRATVRSGLDLLDVLRALFPCGSVTGAPKRAAMAAIAAVERRPRGVYCGAVGYLEPGSPLPTARFSVAIRTLTVSARTGFAEYGAGGGITWPSTPDAEWQELWAKTAVLRPEPPAAADRCGYRPG